MNFFSFKAGPNKLVMSHDIWIYAVAFATLTGITLILWRMWMKFATKSAADLEAQLDEKNSI